MELSDMEDMDRFGASPTKLDAKEKSTCPMKEINMMPPEIDNRYKILFPLEKVIFFIWIRGYYTRQTI